MEELDEKKSILIIDDDDAICRTLMLILNKIGYHVETAKTGKVALEKVQARYYHVAFLDLKLPDINGLELLQPLKNMHPDIEVMMMTGHGSMESAMHALNLGASSYITKPLNMDEVLSKIRDILEKQSLTLEKRRVEKALLREKSFNEGIIAALPGLFYIFDENGRFIQWNKNVEVASEYSSEEVSKMIFMDFFVKKDKMNIANTLIKVFTEGEAIVEGNFKSKSGKITPYYITGVRTVIDNKSYLVGLGIDITKRRKTEEQLKKYQYHLEELVNERTHELKETFKDLEQFVYVASHDLREPLRTITSFTQLLSKRYKDKLDDDANEYIKFAVDGAHIMDELIGDLLSYSGVGTRGKAFKMTDCREVLDNIIFGLQASIQESGAKITHNNLPTVMVDSSQFIQLLQNLIGNAIKFHGEKPPRIHISTKQEDNKWVFSVKDNGIGIDPKYFNQIFEIFKRLHTREEYSGSGIGLAICKKIVERHGGQIWVESEVGKGSTFYFTI